MAEDQTRGGSHHRYLLVTLLVLLGALILSATADAKSNVRVENDTRDYVVGPPSNSPEGVIYDEGTEAFYGGSTSDGTLYKQTLDAPPGQPAEVFLPAGAPDGRTEAVGVNVDEEGRLYVSGGSTGTLFVYDIETREPVARFDTGSGGFINDVDITEDGDVYFTDSFRPFIYRVTEEQVDSGTGTPEAIPLAPEVRYQPGFNANGIRVADEDDKSDDEGDIVIFGDTNDGALYRLRVVQNPADREITQILIRKGQTDNPDGLELDEQTLYVVNNRQELIVEVKLSKDYLSGKVVSNTTSPRFHTPTTISLAPDDRLLVSNAEFFDQSEAGPPYFVTSIPRP